MVVLAEIAINETLLKPIKGLYVNSRAPVKMEGELRSLFEERSGLLIWMD